MENIQNNEAMPKEEDVRSNIIEEYGFNEDDDVERIDKLTAKEMKHHKKLSDAIGQKIKYREELEKKEPEPQPEPSKVEPPKEDMSLKDIRALGDVHDDDVDDVIDFAKYKNITVAEAKKSPTMQSLLKAKTEERKTAEVTNTGGSRGGSSKVSPEALIQNANKGKFPESDEGIDALMHAKLHGKKN